MTDKTRAFELIETVAIKNELPYDLSSDYILVRHVPKDTDRGRFIEQDIKWKLRKAGYKAKTEWVDTWTLKVNVL